MKCITVTINFQASKIKSFKSDTNMLRLTISNTHYRNRKTDHCHFIDHITSTYNRSNHGCWYRFTRSIALYLYNCLFINFIIFFFFSEKFLRFLKYNLYNYNKLYNTKFVLYSENWKKNPFNFKKHVLIIILA